MRVTVNGSQMDLQEGLAVSGLLSELGLSDRRVAVELNRAILCKDGYCSAALKDGDVVEVISFVGGG